MPDIFQDSSRYFHISAFYALSLPYYHMEHHTHSSYEIMYITSGSCRVFCMDEDTGHGIPAEIRTVYLYTPRYTAQAADPGAVFHARS